MKSACFALLVICTLQFVHAGPDPFEKFENIAKFLVEVTKDADTQFQDLLEHMRRETLDRLQYIAMSGREAHDIIFVRALFSNYNGNNVDPCLNKHWTEVLQKHEVGILGGYARFQRAEKRLNEVHRSFNGNITAMHTSVNVIKEIINGCTTPPSLWPNPMCINVHKHQLRQAIWDIVIIRQDTMELAINEFKTISGKTNAYIKNLTETFENFLQNIVNECSKS